MAQTYTDNLHIPKIDPSRPFLHTQIDDALEAIDEAAAPITHVGDKSHWKLWEQSTAYGLKEVFRTSTCPSWGFWEVTQAGTSGTTEPTGYGEGDTFNDGTCKLVLRRLTQGGGSSVKPHELWADFQASHLYVMGDVFRSAGTPSWGYWEVTQAGTSGTQEPTGTVEGTTVTSGTMKCVLKRIGSGSGKGLTDWKQGEPYSEGDTAIYNNAIYKANTDTDTTQFKESEWDEVGAGSSSSATAKEWETSKKYYPGDMVRNDNQLYFCLAEHTSSVFETDLEAEYWKLVSNDQTVIGYNGSYSQITKIEATSNTTVNINVSPDFSYCRQPVEVLKFQQGETSNIVNNTFDVSDKEEFEDNDYIEFDGTAHLKTQYEYPMEFDADVEDSDGITQYIFSTVDLVDSSKYKNIINCSLYEPNIISSLSFDDPAYILKDKFNNKWSGTPQISSEKKFGTNSIVTSQGAIYFDNIYEFLNDSITIEFWVKINENGTQLKGICSCGFVNMANGTGFTIELTNNNVIAYCGYSGAWSKSQQLFVNDFEWHHFSITIKKVINNNYDLNFYIDGNNKWSLNNNLSFSSYLLFLGRDEYSQSSLDANFDEVRLSSNIVYNTNFTPPSRAYYNVLALLKSDNVWGIDSTLEFKQLATNWSSMTNSEKLSIMQQIIKEPTFSDMSEIGASYIIGLQESINTNNKIILQAIPNTQTIFPKNLIRTDIFEKINSIAIDNIKSGTGDIKVAVTNDLDTYRIWDGDTWTEIQKEDIPTDGMSLDDLEALTDTEWAMLLTAEVDSGIAFAYSFDMSSYTDQAAIDKLTLNVEMRGTWNKAIHGTDYNYGYPSYDLLRVTLLTNGTYKINYLA